MNNSLLIIVAVFLALSMAGNAALTAFIMGLIRRHDAQIDKLTSKLMSRDITEYKVAEQIVEPRQNHIKNIETISVAEADPEAVMRALAEQNGRIDDYQEFGGGEA